MKIGVLGTGLMGQPMVLRLLEANLKVTAYNRTASKLQPLQAAGANIVNSPKAAIEAADCSLFMLSDRAAIEELLLSPQSLSHLANRNKIKGSSNWLKLQRKIAKLHFIVANRREDWLYKLAHYFCSQTDNIFVEDINFTSWQKGLFGKQIGNSAIGKFINQILPFVAWKRGVFYQKVDKDYSSQQCPNCGALTGKKDLNQRVHKCSHCGYEANRDVAAAKIIELRGRVAVGQPVNKNACGGAATGVIQNRSVRSSWHPMKQESPVSDGGTVNKTL